MTQDTPKYTEEELRERLGPGLAERIAPHVCQTCHKEMDPDFESDTCDECFEKWNNE